MHPSTKEELLVDSLGAELHSIKLQAIIMSLVLISFLPVSIGGYERRIEPTVRACWEFFSEICGERKLSENAEVLRIS